MSKIHPESFVTKKSRQERKFYVYIYITLIFLTAFKIQVPNAFLKSHSTVSPFPKCLNKKFVSLLEVKDLFPLQKPSKLRIKRKEDILLYMEENSKLNKNSKPQFKRVKLQISPIIFSVHKMNVEMFCINRIKKTLIQ